MTNFLNFLLVNLPELKIKLFEQFFLVGTAIFFSLIIGIPIGILLTRTPRLKNFILNIVGVIWTIPSLALLAFFIPVLGIGFKPAVLTLSLYALLPIISNTVVGIESVPEAIIEAARGLGFTNWQQLWIVKLPLALPIIIAGIRTAIAISVGVATLAAFVGAGGLGDFITQGLALNNIPLLLLGAVPAALMALILDFIVGRIEKVIHNKTYKKFNWSKLKIISFSGVMLIALGTAGLFTAGTFQSKPIIRIGSKNFTEQIILGEMMAQLLEAKNDYKIVRKFNLGTTAICQAAMLKGEIDIYPEYTGTAYLTVLNLTKSGSAEEIFNIVKNNYKQKFDLIWLSPFGFENTQALAVRREFAEKYHLKTISDLKAIEDKLIIGVPAEFMLRADALIGLTNTYQIKFNRIRLMEPGLMYAAIKNDDVNIINAFSTDDRIFAYHLVTLIDDKHFYPPYYAAPVIRAAVLNKYPEISKVLKPLIGLLTNEMMMKLNYEVDINHQAPKAVVNHFLHEKRLLE